MKVLHGTLGYRYIADAVPPSLEPPRRRLTHSRLPLQEIELALPKESGNSLGVGEGALNEVLAGSFLNLLIPALEIFSPENGLQA
jgi:hypothetical protein